MVTTRAVLGYSLAACLVILGVAPPNAIAANRREASRASVQKKKATIASVTARRNTLLNVRDGLRALAAKPKPKDLKPDEQKVYDEFVAKANEVADGCDGLARKLAEGMQKQGDLDSLSEMGETESLRLQMAMDRVSKVMSTLSNILKKISDTAQTITQNLK